MGFCCTTSNKVKNFCSCVTAQLSLTRVGSEVICWTTLATLAQLEVMIIKLGNENQLTRSHLLGQFLAATPKHLLHLLVNNDIFIILQSNLFKAARETIEEATVIKRKVIPDPRPLGMTRQKKEYKMTGSGKPCWKRCNG